MNRYTATVIKTGNSYALRVPKQYIEDAELTLGQKVQVSGPLATSQPHNPAVVRQAIRNLQQVSAYSDIEDPAAWQRKIREDRPTPNETT